MADNWTPITDVVRQACTFERNRLGEPRTIPAEAFDRWLAKVQADALRAAGERMSTRKALYVNDYSGGSTREFCAAWLRAEADRIEKETDRV